MTNPAGPSSFRPTSSTHPLGAAMTAEDVDTHADPDSFGLANQLWSAADARKPSRSK